MLNDFERAVSRQLKRAKITFQYEPVKIPYVLAGHYIPDFVLQTPLGKVYVECKGYLRRENKRKMVAVKKQHPEIDLRILFYASKKQDIKWAVKNGFRYAISKIPKDWLKGM